MSHAFKARLLEFAKRLRLDVAVGKPLTIPERRRAERAWGPLAPDFVAFYSVMNGFSLSWPRGGGATGFAPLGEIRSLPGEDTLWNDEFDEQFEPGCVPLRGLRQMRVLWRFPGTSFAVGITRTARQTRLAAGEPNQLRSVALKLPAFADACLQPMHDLISMLAAR